MTNEDKQTIDKLQAELDKLKAKLNNPNRLPESWCVKNDGSQLFKDTVLKYLDHGFKGGIGELHYGIYKLLNGETQTCKIYPFGKLLTIQEFIELSGMEVPKPDKRGFTWGDSFSGDGAYMHSTNSEVCEINGIEPEDVNKCVFRNTDYAESSLAYAQLTHIVAKYNEGKEIDIDGWVYCIEKHEDKLVVESFRTVQPLLTFNTLEYAQTSLEVNRELWEQFWMVK